MFPLCLCSLMDMEILILQQQNFTWVPLCVRLCANEECCLCYSVDIEICHTEYTWGSILPFFIHICSNVGLMLSHDGWTECWGTDGSNCLMNLELLNISEHKVEETKHAVCSGSEMPAAVRVDNPTAFTSHWSIGGAAPTRTLHSKETSIRKLE